MGELIAFLIGIFLRMMLRLLAYSPIFFLSGYITMYFSQFYPKELASMKIIPMIIAILITYLVYCFVFFLKGLLIALKENKNKFWFLLMFVLIISLIIMPVVISYLIIKWIVVDKFGYTNSLEIEILSGILSVMVGVLVYKKKYQFHKDNYPSMAEWSYKYGFLLGLKFIKNPKTEIFGKDVEFQGTTLRRYMKD